MLGLTYGDCDRLKKAEAALREALRLAFAQRGLPHFAFLGPVPCGDRRGALATTEQGLAIDPCTPAASATAACISACWELAGGRGNAAGIAEARPGERPRARQHGLALYFKAHAQAGDPALGERHGQSALYKSLQHCQEVLRLDPSSEFARTTAAAVLLVRPRCIICPFGLLAGLVGLVDPSPHRWYWRSASEPARPRTAPGFSGVGGPGPSRPPDGAFSGGPFYLLMRRTRLGEAVLLPGRRLRRQRDSGLAGRHYRRLHRRPFCRASDGAGRPVHRLGVDRADHRRLPITVRIRREN